MHDVVCHIANTNNGFIPRGSYNNSILIQVKNGDVHREAYYKHPKEDEEEKRKETTWASPIKE